MKKLKIWFRGLFWKIIKEDGQWQLKDRLIPFLIFEITKSPITILAAIFNWLNVQVNDLTEVSMRKISVHGEVTKEMKRAIKSRLLE